MTRGFLHALSALLVVGATACAKSPPRTPPAIALAIPTPPARLLIPVELPEYVEPQPAPAASDEPSPEPARTASGARPTDRPAPPPATPAAADAPPPPVLRTTADAGALAQKITGLLGSAEERLKTVNFRTLSPTGRAHYDQARSFIRMANEALLIKNYMYAEQLATKANTVAGLLLKS